MKFHKRNEWLRKNKLEILCFFMIIIVFVLRSPQLIINGRFWAEEGRDYFQYAYNHNIIETVFFVYKRCGYYYLWVNICVLLASLFPLEYAPAIVTWLAFGMNVLIYAYIFWTPSLVLKSRFSKTWFCLLSVIGVHITAEVYCNAINSQVFFGIFMLCYFFRDIDKINLLLPKKKKVYLIISNILLIIACLSGLYALILFPAFFLRYCLKRRKDDKVTLIYMVTPLIIQMVVFFLSSVEGTSGRSLSFFNVQAINYTILHTIIIPVFGNSIAARISEPVIYILLISLGVYCFVIKKRVRNSIIFQLIGLLSYYVIFVNGASLGGGGAGGRYAVVPVSILLLLFAFIFQNRVNHFCTIISVILIVLPLWFGIVEYQSPKNYKVLDYYNAPNWKEEVAAYNANSNYSLRIWPYQKSWTITLDD